MNSAHTIPIVDALKKYIRDETVRFHMPGHKGGRFPNKAAEDLLGNKVFQADVTNVPGLDDLHQPHGVIKAAQEMAAQVFGADQTYFLVNGSSCGLQALVMTVCNPGDKILVPRNIHRSILGGIILSGAIPVFFMPEYDDKFDIPLGTAPATLQRCLEAEAGIKAVLIVNPTYHGIVSDIDSIARIAHAANIPLLVDEAHGPHLKFHQRLPKSSLENGADAVVHGTHKLLGALTQASMLHIKAGRINQRRLEAALKMLQSTSTSYLLLSSLDAARAQVEREGKEALDQALAIAEYIRVNLSQINSLEILGSEITGKPGAFGYDPTKITVSLKQLQISGFWAEEWLRHKYRIQVEMSDLYNILLLISFGNTRQDADKVIDALAGTAHQAQNHPAIRLPTIRKTSFLPTVPELAVPPREAFFAPAASVPLESAIGRVSTEVIACYPPGIPIICPGERINGEIVDYLTTMRGIGARFQGCYDSHINNIYVMA